MTQIMAAYLLTQAAVYLSIHTGADRAAEAREHRKNRSLSRSPGALAQAGRDPPTDS